MEQNNTNMPEEKRETRKLPMTVSILIGAIILSSFFGAVSGFLAGGGLNYKNGLFSKNKNASIDTEKIIQEDSAVTDMIQKSSPAVVSIAITKNVSTMRDFFGNPFDGFGFFFNPFDSQNQNNGQTEKQKVGGGSGFFVSSNGMVVTNRHVVEDTDADYTVVTNDGKEYPTKVLARDSVRDVAVIKIEGDNFPTLSLGDSDQLKIGETVVAIGNSLGEFSNTVSKGIISGLRRSVTAGSGLGQTEQLSNMIQTDAAINPGNSGGPLLDISGNVIGINVAMAQGAENIGFAIPSNQVARTIDQVKTQGKISNPFLGIRSIAITKKIQTDNNLPFSYGALVVRGQQVTDFAVMPGSPADKAGIVENDIILEINGEQLNATNSISDLITKYNVGEEITLKIWHKGETKDIKVKLEEKK